MNKQKNKSIQERILTLIAVVLIAGLVSWSLTNWWNQPTAADSGYQQVMGTVARMVVVGDDGKELQSAIDAAFEEIERIESVMSTYRADSLISQINEQAFDTPVPLSDEMRYLLKEAIHYSQISGGAFDITIGPELDLWQAAGRQQRTPGEEEIQAAREKTGYQKLTLDPFNKTIRFQVEGMKLDLGGIAKGYAIDRVVDVLKAGGVLGAMVDIGGDIRCFGTPLGKAKKWVIGLQDPEDDEKMLLRLYIADAAVATSGDYRRFVSVDGKKHGHIIDPAEADSARSLTSVTVIAPTAMQADALATAVSVLGKDKGMDLIESLPDVETLVIPADAHNQTHMTAGIARYITEKGE